MNETLDVGCAEYELCLIFVHLFVGLRLCVLFRSDVLFTFLFEMVAEYETVKREH